MARQSYHHGKLVCLLTVLITNSLLMSPLFAHTTDVATQNAHKEGDANANAHDLIQGSHVDGHIAFLKAELAIRPEQESLWEPVANAMRDDVRNLQEAEAHAHQKPGPQNAVEYLENRAIFANVRAQGEARFLNVFRPLYDHLSQQQKEVADGLLIPSSAE